MVKRMEEDVDISRRGLWCINKEVNSPWLHKHTDRSAHVEGMNPVWIRCRKGRYNWNFKLLKSKVCVGGGGEENETIYNYRSLPKWIGLSRIETACIQYKWRCSSLIISPFSRVYSCLCFQHVFISQTLLDQIVSSQKSQFHSKWTKIFQRFSEYPGILSRWKVSAEVAAIK